MLRLHVAVTMISPLARASNDERQARPRSGTECLLESFPIVPCNMKDSLARIAPSETAIGPPSPTAHRLVAASVSANTHRAYAGDRGRGRGLESDQVAAARPSGRRDRRAAVYGGMRRSEVAARRLADVADAGDADGILVTVRRSKTRTRRARPTGSVIMVTPPDADP